MRPYVIVFALSVCAVAITGLVWFEKMPRRAIDDVVERANEPLRQFTYVASRRRDNFTDMGMNVALADETAVYAQGLMARNHDRFKELLEKAGVDVGVAFCLEPSQLPQPFGALRYLVTEEGRDRIVRPSPVALEPAAWYDTNNDVIREVYFATEARKDRREDATLMAITAILVRREAEAIERRNHWSSSAFFGGTFNDVVAESPSLRTKAVQYFAAMHVFTEIANEPDGLCDSELL